MTRKPLIAVLALTGTALAHFPILVPATPWAELEKETELTYAYGHPYEVERVPARRPIRFTVFTPGDASVDLLPGLPKDEKADPWRARWTPKERGDHVVATTSPVGEHEGKKFQDFTKLVVHVPSVQGGWERVIGDPLEVVPLTRPYGLEPCGSFRAEVLADGQPLAHCEVEVEYMNGTAPAKLPPEPFVTRVERTDRAGAFSTTLERAGWWIVCASRETKDGVQRASLWVHVGPPK
jgi:cobalt/nickel transport protein